MDRREFLSTALALPALGLGLSPVRSPSGATIDPRRLGASTACLAGMTLPGALRELRRLGFATVEIIAYTGARHSVGEIPGFDFHGATEPEREQVFAATRGFRHISAHMPFQNLSLLAASAEERRHAEQTIRGAMDGLAYLRGEMAVVHAGWPDRGTSYRDIWKRAVDTFRALGDYAGERGLRLGLETMQPSSVRDYTELIFDIDHPAVGAVVDTGHIRGSSDIGLAAERRDTAEGRERFNEVLLGLVGQLGERAFHFHLSDVRGSEWRDHHTVGSGIIDFARLIDLLRSQRYRGLLVFELEEPDTVAALRASQAYVRRLIRA